MKNFYSLKIFFALLAILITAHFVSAVFVPGPVTPPTNTPAPFLDVSSTGQTKQGWLRLGGSGTPTATLDVLGTTVSNTLGVVGDSWVSGKLRVGGITIPAATDPTLVVTGGHLRSSILAGTGIRPVCADANGLLKICTTGPVTQCNDGIDNTDPEDTLVDIADPGCLSGPGGAYNSADNDETNTAVASTCGSASNTTPVSTAPTTNLCTPGNTASSVTSNANSYNWTCTNGTSTPSACSVPKSSIVWNSATCTATATKGSQNDPSFVMICPNATYQGNNILTYDKELNGVITNLINANYTPMLTSPNTQLGNYSHPTLNDAEIKWDGTYGANSDLKAVRFRPKSGSVLGDWGPYKAYFKPTDPVSATLPAKQITANSIILNWALSNNENTTPLPKVISYRVLACDTNTNSDCVVVTSLSPGTTSTYIPTPVTAYFGQPKPYFTDAGSTRCTLVTNGGNTQCNYYIQAYINTPYLPETTGTSGLVNKLPYNIAGGGLQNKPVYYSSNLIQFP